MGPPCVLICASVWFNVQRAPVVAILFGCGGVLVVGCGGRWWVVLWVLLWAFPFDLPIGWGLGGFLLLCGALPFVPLVCWRGGWGLFVFQCFSCLRLVFAFVLGV